MKFSELDGAAVVLWGLGRETNTFRRQLEQRLPGARVSAVIDDGTPEREAREQLAAADVLVRSPGVSIYKPLIQEARASGTTVTTATGLWLAERAGRHVIGVTGTKGKSTTATIVAHLLRQVRPDTELAGNIGRPVIELIDLAASDSWVVLELSSYQIADLAVGPEVAVITNLSREHTDWHGSEDQYRADKLRLLTLPGVRVIVDPLGCAAPVSGAPTWRVDDEGSVRGAETVVRGDQLPLRGRHNALNLVTALLAIEAAGFAVPPMPESLAGLEPLPHRLQTAHLDDRGVEWVDDSISTTPESTIAAIEAFPGRQLVLIVGGSDRSQDHSRLAQVLAAREVETELIHLPDTGGSIASAAATCGFVAQSMSPAGDMREAVTLARLRARAGSVVLLSPAAPSYNAYANFEQRGDDFAALARAVDLPA